ncbi:MAG: imelysin family protein [Bacteroidia bacterium]|nr:imelysin family protein [Bacteroidia bacterium]
MNNTLKLLWIPLALLLGACKPEGPQEPDFDRQAMLTHYADQLILPAYTALQTRTAALQAAYTAFDTDRSEASLAVLRQAWLEAAIAWQSANAYNFGPAGEAGIRKGLIEEIGTFPANEARIEDLIAAGDISLNNFSRDTRGFPSIEYLIFGSDQPVSEVLAALEAPSRRAYLGAIVQHLHTRVSETLAAWSSYRADFTANAGTDAGSSTSLLYNEFVRSFESIKNFKVGLPAGLRAGQTQAAPQLVESRYAKQSRALMGAHLDAIGRIYYGQGSSDGPGLYEYLRAVTGGPELAAATETQWNAVQSALAQIPAAADFGALIAAGDPRVAALHTELQKHTRYFKSDLSSLLGIAITFSSGDGD